MLQLIDSWQLFLYISLWQSWFIVLLMVVVKFPKSSKLFHNFRHFLFQDSYSTFQIWHFDKHSWVLSCSSFKPFFLVSLKIVSEIWWELISRAVIVINSFITNVKKIDSLVAEIYYESWWRNQQTHLMVILNVAGSLQNLQCQESLCLS